MDPERIHSYLQAACAGLGFDVGEVWFSSSETSSSTVAAIEQRRFKSESDDDPKAASNQRNIKFLQLYTSKSFKNRRNDLLKPESENSASSQGNNKDDDESITKHVLSPMLVNAIANTAQVVWANCQKQEGLLGRSDMRLQTAVGMPVAMDSLGNMCIVVMFSPNDVQSSKDAMEYIKLISQGAASSRIPCLLPVVDSTQNKLAYNPKRFSDWQQNEMNAQNNGCVDDKRNISVLMEKTTEDSTDDLNDELFPKDAYGIPILPEFFDFTGDNDGHRKHSGASSPSSEDLAVANEFDTATFGLWSTIMNSTKDFDNSEQRGETNPTIFSPLASDIKEKVYMEPERKERLEEFVSAFLGLSIFDIGDVWVPAPDESGVVCLHNVFSISSAQTKKSSAVPQFKNVSRFTTIKGWSGAVGRAQCTGNSVWSTNQEIIVDSGRKEVFAAAAIQTAVAVPIFSQGSNVPSCVLCCYSMIKSDPVTFVLKFVQQALRSLWMGLDNVKPHESIGKELWKDVAPADLGEMAADAELQKAFYRKRKRPLGKIPNGHKRRTKLEEENRARSSSLALQLQSLSTQSNHQDEPERRSEPILQAPNPQQAVPDATKSLTTAHTTTQQGNSVASLVTLQSHLQQALQSVQNAQPMSVYQDMQRNQSNAQNVNMNTMPSSSIPTYQTFHNSNQNSTTATGSMPPINTNDFKEDPAVAKSYIDALNAMVQQTSESMQFQQTEAIGGLAMGNFHSIPHNTNQQPIFPNSSNFISFPDSTLSNGMGAPVYLPTGTGSPVCLPTNTGVPVCLPTDTSLNNPPLNSFSTINSFSTTSAVSQGTICRIEGCNSPSVSRRPYCTRHSGNRTCEHSGCEKCAQGATRFCIAHGGGRRCTYPGCDKGARDKFFCAAHGGGKRCSKQGCSKSAVGGSSLCTSHGGGRRCSIDGCEKSAQSSTKFCVKHGGGKKCAQNGCDKVARGRTLYCAGHGGGVRCKLAGCSRIAIGKMQLCRAHGGGSSRAKAKLNQGLPTDGFFPQPTMHAPSPNIFYPP